MIPTLAHLREETHNKVNDARRIDAIVLGEAFEEIWKSVDENVKFEIVNRIQWVDKEGLIKCLKANRKMALGQMSIHQLRKLGNGRVPRFMTLSKSTLLCELSKLKDLGEIET